MEKLVRKRKIMVSKDKIPVIMDRFGCRRVAVYNALAYRSNSDLAKEIRMEALQKCGGRRVNVAVFEEDV